jgi:hypothetical protein
VGAVLDTTGGQSVWVRDVGQRVGLLLCNLSRSGIGLWWSKLDVWRHVGFLELWSFLVSGPAVQSRRASDVRSHILSMN